MFLENKPTRKSFNDLKNLLKSIEDEKNFHRSLIKEKLVNFIN